MISEIGSERKWVAFLSFAGIQEPCTHARTAVAKGIWVTIQWLGKNKTTKKLGWQNDFVLEYLLSKMAS